MNRTHHKAHSDAPKSACGRRCPLLWSVDIRGVTCAVCLARLRGELPKPAEAIARQPSLFAQGVSAKLYEPCTGTVDGLPCSVCAKPGTKRHLVQVPPRESHTRGRVQLTRNPRHWSETDGD